MEMTLEGGEGGELDAGDDGRGVGWGESVEQNAQERRDAKVCRIFYLKRFVLINWLIGDFDLVDCEGAVVC